MDKKLTDSEIVKALECCIDTIGVNCGECPYCDNCVTDENTSLMMTDALDLINRLQAEKDTMQHYIDHLKAENERLKKSNEMFTDIGKMYSEIKIEAYKEFAELLHCQCESIINQPHNENVRLISWKVAYEEFDDKVDNLLKELVGDKQC